VVLQPLWANEAMHRAWSFSRLLLRLDQGDVGEDPFSRILEERIAEKLAQAYGELRIRADVAMQPCSQILQNVVINLVGLFSPARRILLRTAIDPLVLSEFKRRALVLLGSELVMNALAHAFNEPTGGEIKVMLEVSTGGSARLVVSDDGCGMNVQAMGVCCPIASDLADLLETDLDRRPGPNGGSSVEAAFSWRG
jgi:two-component sensor histidine kinase